MDETQQADAENQDFDISTLTDMDNMQEYMDLAVVYGLSLLYALAILFFGWMAAKFIRRLVAKGLRNARVDGTLINFFANIVYAVVITFVIIASLSKLGIQTASLIAVIGAAGLAIGMALQGSLSNFAAGVMIIFFKHYRVGDFIEGAGVSGTVENLDIFNTTLRTPNNQQVIIPNANLTGGAITNYSSFPTRRVDLTIGIGYDDDIKKARQVVTDLLSSESRILQDEGINVLVRELGDSSVNLAVRCWTKTSDYWDVVFEYQEKIKNAFDKEGISIPYPQRDVHMYDMNAQKMAKAS